MNCRLAFSVLLSVLSGISCISNATWRQYGGEAFPIKYLSPEESIVTSADVDYYIKLLHLPLKYFLKQPLNDTDVNTAFGAYYAKSLLKRAIVDHGAKLRNDQIGSLKKLIFMCEDILSHYIYINGQYDWDDMEYRISKLFVSDETQIYSIGDFNRGRLRQWILTKHNNMNRYLQEMDMATLPKEKYVELVDENTDEQYHIDMFASVSLCAMLGYEEFHRKSWFYKAASWINAHGCVVEHDNFVKNRTKMLRSITGARQRRMYIAYFCKLWASECNEHPTALLMIVLAHAIRHAAKFMQLI
ncbi:unnamed protein product [Diatraea saccharalis]|uniref:Uncharacterized protein n=1 Tax=Diatraea saccharalis TaxID=40085 RepID=A0A9N9R1C9_9NEOP|nr:unnamed protein product [Diatraea saccharalis]